MRGQAFVALGALVCALAATAQPAAAQGYGQGGYYSATPQQTYTQQACQDSRNRRMVGGAVIGALAGAVLGNNMGDHENDMLGAVLGGAAGAAIGRQTARCETPQQQGYYGRGQPAPYQQPYGDDDDLYGGPYQPSSYGGQQSSANCRWGEVVTRDPDGYEMRDRAYMCRGRDGVWRVQG